MLSILRDRTLGRSARALAALALAAVVAAGCSPDSILRVTTPDVVDPANILTPGGIQALRAGAIGDYAFAMDGNNGGTEGLILVTGMMSDEYVHSGTFPTRQEYDRRTIDVQNGTLTGVFRNVMRSRRSAEQAADFARANALTAADSLRIAETYALAGNITHHIAAAYCSGIPFSEADLSGNLTFGSPLTTAQIFQRAIQRFDSALAYPAGTSATATTNRRFALVGKARALLGLGQYAAAAALVTPADVPSTFSYLIQHSSATSRQSNGIFAFNVNSERWSVANLDGGNGLNYRSANDPRVVWRRSPANDLGFDNATPQYDLGKYRDLDAPVSAANGIDARLIEAEAALQTDPVAWLGILNTLRATASLIPAPPPGYPTFPALTPLVDPGTQAARVDLHFRERAFWLYAEGHRLGDMRRLVRQYGRTAASVFPGGGGQPYVLDGNSKGGIFGDQTSLPVPGDELNNPQAVICDNVTP